MPLSEEACPLEEVCHRFVVAAEQLAEATASYYDKKNKHFVHLLQEENSSEAARFTSKLSVAMHSIANCGLTSLLQMVDKASTGEYLEDVQRAEFRQGLEELELMAKTSGDTPLVDQLPDMLVWARYLEKKVFANGCASVTDPVLAKEMTAMCEKYVKCYPQGAGLWLQGEVLPILHSKLEGLCRIPRDDTNAAVAPCRDYLDMISSAEKPTGGDANLQHKALQKVTRCENTSTHAQLTGASRKSVG